jgi:C4-dicarboxylate transporter DctM subunit
MGTLELVVIIVLLSLLLIAMGVPVAFAMLLTGTAGIIWLNGIESALYTLGTFPISRISSFSWTALPLFILMGNLALASGVGTSAYGLARTWLRGIKGSLVLVSIGACGLIGATSGSGATGTLIMGKIAVPEMKKYGYDKKLSVGAITASGTVGLLIPPSGSLLLIGILTYLSIGKLFAAGILPGILSLLVFMGMVYTRCALNPRLAPNPKEVQVDRTGWKEKLYLLVRDGTGILVLFLGVMIPLFLGLATPTETGALGSLIALILWFVAKLRRKSDWAALRESIVDTVKVSAMLFAFIIGTGVFSIFLALAGVVPFLLDFVNGLPISPLATLILIMLCYIPLGMFLDTISIILLTVPVVYPVVVDGLGFNGILFAILLVKMVELSAITPPIGLSLFLTKGILPDVSLGDIIRGTSWFAAMDLVTLMILIALPQITLFIPGLMPY